MLALLYLLPTSAKDDGGDRVPGKAIEEHHSLEEMGHGNKLCAILTEVATPAMMKLGSKSLSQYPVRAGMS